MLEVFENWFLVYSEILDKENIEWNIVKSNEKSDNPGFYIDFDTPNTLSRITIWESGDMVVEVLNCETGEELLVMREDFVNKKINFEEKLEYFFSIIKLNY